jgi:L-fuconolactonase
MNMRLDAHQHFWNYDARQYPWINDDKLRRDFLPKDLATELERVHLDGSIAVQARTTVDESRWLLTLADHFPLIKGVVGWVDLLSATVERELAELAQHPRFVGVRHVVQDEPDDRFMLRPGFLNGLSLLRKHKLTYDLLIYPKQLPAAIEVVQKFPQQPFVLDHLAKPFIKRGALSPWKEQIETLAKSPNVSCKVSGMVTEADRTHWKPADFTPYLDVVFQAFGEDRLMFGSDWPVCLLAGSYEQVHEIVATYLKPLSAQTQEKVMGGNAAKFYGVK